jgi:hypothetical protein
MISANSENEQATVISLTETELEGIYGGWGHDCYRRDDDCYESHSESIEISININSCDNYDSYNSCDRYRRCW